MRQTTRITLLALLAALAACASDTVLVTVPPRMDLKGYGALGIVEFTSNAPGTAAHATRQFEEQVQAAQPGTPFLELGDRETVLAAVGARELDAATLRKIGQKYGVRALFVGDIVYAEPHVDVKVVDVTKLEGGVRAEMRGDISSRLYDTANGASVWSSSAWARRQIGSLQVRGDAGLSGDMSGANARDEMVPALVYHLTEDFRSSTARQPAR
ncbi:MAG TPA: hypothetical protein VFI86_10310 [Burkholderiales bacterium]|nr:hypothetical protein [Burkholderiales bacterium]